MGNDPRRGGPARVAVFIRNRKFALMHRCDVPQPVKAGCKAGAVFRQPFPGVLLYVTVWLPRSVSLVESATIIVLISSCNTIARHTYKKQARIIPSTIRFSTSSKESRVRKVSPI